MLSLIHLTHMPKCQSFIDSMFKAPLLNRTEILLRMPLCVCMCVRVFIFLDLSCTLLGRHIVEMHPSSLIDYGSQCVYCSVCVRCIVVCVVL